MIYRATLILQATVLLYATLLVLAPLALSEESLELKDGTTLTNAQVKRLEPDGVTVIHSLGAAKIPFHELPDEWQTKYGYDPKAAAAYTAKRKHMEAQARFRRQQQQREKEALANYTQLNEEFQKDISRRRFTINGVVMQVLSDGILLRDPAAVVRKPARRTYRAVQRERRVEYQPLTASGEPVFIAELGIVLHDGEEWQGVVYPAGRYRYVSVSGATKTVEAFALTPSKAVKMHVEQINRMLNEDNQ